MKFAKLIEVTHMTPIADILRPLQNCPNIMSLVENKPVGVVRKNLLVALAESHHISSGRKLLNKLKSLFWFNHHPSAELLHGVLVELARHYPCDSTCCFTQEPVDFEYPETYVPIAEGHVFDKKSLGEWLEQKFTNPLTNLPFIPEDAEYLRKIYPHQATDAEIGLLIQGMPLAGEALGAEVATVFLNPNATVNRPPATDNTLYFLNPNFRNPQPPIGDILGAQAMVPGPRFF
jgi:hypothetical protein